MNSRNASVLYMYIPFLRKRIQGAFCLTVNGRDAGIGDNKKRFEE
jgi:hypothetical protein